MNRGEILPTPDINVYALHYAKPAAIARRTIARQADGKAWRGMDIQRPPYKDEVQYADDLLHGRRKSDVVIIVGSAIVGGVQKRLTDKVEIIWGLNFTDEDVLHATVLLATPRK